MKNPLLIGTILTRVLTYIVIAFSLAQVHASAQLQILDTAVNPNNGHTYHLLANSTWTEAESRAVALGGHLATINDLGENSWIWNRWGTNRSLWIGLNDAASEGTFVWSSGSAVAYRNWRPGEPNGDDYVYILAKGLSGEGQWNDLANLTTIGGQPPTYGVVEVVPGTQLERETLRIHIAAIELEFTTKPGRLYQLESSSNAVDWIAFGGVVEGTGSNLNQLVSIRNTDQKFYRLVTLDQSDGLVAYYPFNGNTRDHSTNANHGIPSNIALTMDRRGIPNAAYRFAGDSTSFIRVPDSPSLDVSNALTITAWINFDVGVTTFPMIIDKNVYEIVTDHNNLGARNLYAVLKTPDETILSTPSPILRAGQWHFVAVTYDGAEARLYVDEQLSAATPVSGQISVNNLDLNIGRNTQTSSNNFCGAIDDVRIYDRSLSESELSDLSGRPEVTAGLVAHHRFNGNAQDSSPNGNHGTAIGVTLTTNRFGDANSAYQFAGNSGSYIRVPDSPSLDITNQITLAAWINFEVGGTSFPRILGKNSYQLITDIPTASRRLYASLKTPQETVIGTPSAVMQAGQWYFVVLTYDGSAARLYVNGQMSVTTAVSGQIVVNNFDLDIGRTSETGGDNFKGLIDGVRIYNRALTEGEIITIFQRPD